MKSIHESKTPYEGMLNFLAEEFVRARLRCATHGQAKVLSRTQNSVWHLPFSAYFCRPEKSTGEVPEWPKGTVC